MNTADDKKDKEGKPRLLEEQQAEELPVHEEPEQIEGKEQKMLSGDDKKLLELEDKLLRFQADFENFRKRTAKEHEMLKQNAGASVILNLLEVVDEFGMAMAHFKDEKGEFKEGMEMIYKKMIDALKREGLEEMKSEGEILDPYKHDAIGFETGEEGKIMKVVIPGYLFRGKVLRHAKVIVGRDGNKN